jgi:hypothetical protein
MTKAFSYLPEIEHTFQKKKPIPEPFISKGVSFILIVPLVVFILVV